MVESKTPAEETKGEDMALDMLAQAEAADIAEMPAFLKGVFINGKSKY